MRNMKLKVHKQFCFKDIYGANAKVDFMVINQASEKKYFIECKNQNVKGSVDHKFMYYIENIRTNRYDGEFIFVLNTAGLRKVVLEWLTESSKKENFKIVQHDNLSDLKKLLI